MTRHRDAARVRACSRGRLAIFTDAERVIADPVVRNRGTIGGALCQADPSEDLSAVCAAVDARMVIRGTRRRARHRHATTSTAAPTAPRSAPAEMLDRDPRRRWRGAGQRLREGRAPGRRLGRRRRRRVARRSTAARSPAAGSRSPPPAADITSAEAEAALAGQRSPSDELFARGGARCRRRLLARDRPARLGGVQAPRRRRPDRARAARAPRARGALESQREEVSHAHA